MSRLGGCLAWGGGTLYLYPLLYNAINMASASKIYPKNFNNNNSFKVNTLSALLSGVKTKANTGLILTTYTTQILR